MPFPRCWVWHGADRSVAGWPTYRGSLSEVDAPFTGVATKPAVGFRAEAGLTVSAELKPAPP